MRKNRIVTICSLKSLSVILLAAAVGACAQTAQGTQARAGEPPPAQETEKPAEGTEKPQPPAPKALIATSPDGTKIAYEVTGSGPALMLIHGGGQTRRSWDQIGYVERLSKEFTVITLDMRGVGDSDKPTTPDGYALDVVLADLLAVADAAKADRFHVWAFGQGATIARYLVARSDRVISAVLVGTTMGPSAIGVFKDAATAMVAKWKPFIDAQAAGTLDLSKLSTSDKSAWEAGIGVTASALAALLEYPPLEPSEIKTPTLWVVGADDSAMENAKEYEGKLDGTMVTLKVLSSTNYSDSFVKIDQVLEEVTPFLKQGGATTMF